MPDGGSSADAGATSDAGAVDAGPFDAGAPDAGPPASPGLPALPCAATSDSLYALTDSAFPAFTPAARGDVVGCGFEKTLSIADLTATLSGWSLTATNAVRSYRVAYRTTRSTGAGGISTARVWLPQSVSGPLDLVVAAHGSEGLADGCAPTHDATGSDDLGLMFAARGRVVIAPDYAGLGTDGVQGYLDNRDSGQSVLDAIRAARNLLGPGATTDRVGAVGHSQGGGALLSAQALAQTYGPALTAVVVLAPQYPIRASSFGFLTALRSPASLTISLGISKPAIYVLRDYAYQVNHVGPSTAGDGFPSAQRTSLVAAIESQCLVALGGAVQTLSPHVGELMDDAQRLQLLACADGTSGCTGPGKTYFDFLTPNVLTNDAQGARVLFVQGALDTILPPAEEAACVVDKLRADGLPVQACVDSGALHSTVVGRNVAFTTAWLEAELSGQSLPACPETAALPTCTP